MIAWNFYGLTIILLFLDQLITISDLDCKVFFDSARVFAMSDKELSSAKFYIDALVAKENTSFIEKLSRIGLVMEPSGIPEIIV